MKIAIPLFEGRLSAHFGHCAQFALVDTDEADGSVTGIEVADAPVHAPGVLPQWLLERGTDVVIAGGMGRRAQALFTEAGIQVVIGAPSQPPREVAEQYLAGDLQTGQNICDH